MRPKNIHLAALAKSTAISSYCMSAAIAPLKIIRLLNEQRIRFALIGSHAIGGWMQKPRASPSVDFLVQGPQKACRVLRAAFPSLLVENEGTTIRLREPKEQVFFILLKKPDTADTVLERKAFRNTHPVRFGKQLIPFPSLEMAVALSYAEMTLLPWSNPDKYQAAHDFISIVKVNPEIDLVRLGEFGELVCPGGRQDISERVRTVLAGERFQL